jgi:uncharacterized metal-binding protein
MQTPPLVYACSGCSGAAQLANALAVRLDRGGDAEMSCIAGVGGDVPSLVKVARSGRPIVAIDGCPLDCVARVLARHAVQPTVHHRLSDRGIVKGRHSEYGADTIREELEALLLRIRDTAASVARD